MKLLKKMLAANNMNESFEGRPVLVQGSEHPIIIRENDTDENLLCEGCRTSVLIKHYLADCTVGIGLQCFACGHITWTPSLPPGEVFPRPVLTLGDKGKFLIGSSVINKKNVVITCDQELASVASHSSPNCDVGKKFDLSIESLELLSLELNLLSGGNFTKPLKAAKKSVDREHRYHSENPLAWAVEYIKRQLSDNMLCINEESIVAMSILQGYKDVATRWKNHAHIAHIAKELCNSFYHTLFQLIVAAYLFEHGNSIAINLPSKTKSGRSADLYVRLSSNAKERLYVEIKAPQAVEWPNKLSSFRSMRKIVENCLSSAKGQIGTKKPGILVIGTTCLSPGFFGLFKNATESVLRKKGRKYSGVAGIGIVGLNELALKGDKKVDAFNFSTVYEISVATNMHYFQTNPIKTT